MLNNAIFSMLQRNYLANNISYTQLPDFNQFIQNGEGEAIVGIRKNLSASLSAGQMIWRNALTWDSIQWSTGESSNMSVVYTKLKFKFEWKGLHVLPYLQLQEGNLYLPNHTYGGRLAYTRRVFKAKKMELLFAVDYKNIDAYTLMNYNPLLDNWVMNSQNESSVKRMELHATFGFSIEEFRFFTRIENIQDFWTDPVQQIATNYYRAPFIIRLGLTWDFFN